MSRKDIQLILVGLALLFGLCRGLDEGMTMIQPHNPLYGGPEPGVRGHVWFGWYHVVSDLHPVILIGIVVALCKRRIHWLYIGGLLIVLWEATEVGETIARYGVPIVPYERINFYGVINWVLEGAAVYRLHVARLISGGLLLIEGW